MKMAIQRDLSTSDIIMRISEFAFGRFSQDAFLDEMRKAVTHFVQTDPECQVLINEMTKEAFKGIDLLAVITDAVKAKCGDSSTQKEE